jgi:hypothetical protein
MANYFMLGGDGKEYGPVSAEQLRQWAAEGRANAQTQVRLAEGGAYQALGTVPELNAAGPSPASYAPPAGLAQTMAQNSAMAGADSTLLIKRLAAVLAAAGGWMKFLAVLLFVSAVGMLVPPMTLICWLPIWLGVVLWGAATKMEQASYTGTEADMIRALEQLRFYFKLLGISVIVIFVAMAILTILSFGAIMSTMSQMGGINGLKGM